MKKICEHCGKEFETTNGKKRFCSSICQKIHETFIKFPDNTDYVECKICGFRGNRIDRHIKSEHNMSINDYCEKYGLKKIDLFSKSTRERNSNAQKKALAEGKLKVFTSENNPSNSEECKNGRNSPFSMNFREYDGLSDEEKKHKIELLKSQGVITKKDNNNDPLTLEYYIKRGYAQSEAEELLANRQTTFSLDICIEKYGEEEGKKRWQERQIKWLNNYPKNNYSMISQELFNSIMDNIKNEYKEVYYATNENNEYTLRTINKIYKLDFYIKDINKAIEFDGDYWHNQNLPGNKTRDENKTNDVINSGIKLLRVKERDYKLDKEKVLQECLEFLKS